MGGVQGTHEGHPYGGGEGVGVFIVVGFVIIGVIVVVIGVVIVFEVVL